MRFEENGIKLAYRAIVEVHLSLWKKMSIFNQKAAGAQELMCTAGLAPHLGKLTFLKNSWRYHQMVLGHHKGMSGLHPVQT